MKKILKALGLLILVSGIILAILAWWAHQPRPVGHSPEQADQLANKMLTAINAPAWDTTHWVQWTFRGARDFLWDKQRHFVQVRWGDHEVLLHTKTVTGKAFTNGTPVTGSEADELIQTAWAHFCNDSFWLNAPAKVFDPGTERHLATTDDGRQGLLVTYTSGGVTPGDAYLWHLDATGLPVSYQMWVNIIPIGGLEFSWEDWTTLDGGARIAQFHRSSLLEIPIENGRAATDWIGLQLTSDPFVALSTN